MTDVPARDLRNHAAAVLRRVEAGERLTVTVSRRPAAELAPLGRPVWVSGAAMERVLREAPADRGLLEDLAQLRRADHRARVSHAVLDTSVFIAGEQDRPIRRELPDEVSVSVVSIAEVELGVLVARDAAARAQRLRTLTEVRALGAAVPIDERTGSAYARLAAGGLAAGRKPRLRDTWIAATALVNDAEVWTQDDDFSDFASDVTIVRV